eukprot:5885013-Lingulodinium_polyedra.AAC.1
MLTRHTIIGQTAALRASTRPETARQTRVWAGAGQSPAQRARLAPRGLDYCCCSRNYCYNA